MLCPKCAADLDEVGAVAIGGAWHPIYQCDVCTRRTTLFGVETDAALTFVVDPADGRLLDPETLRPIDPVEN